MTDITKPETRPNVSYLVRMPETMHEQIREAYHEQRLNSMNDFIKNAIQSALLKGKTMNNYDHECTITISMPKSVIVKLEAAADKERKSAAELASKIIIEAMESSDDQ